MQTKKQIDRTCIVRASLKTLGPGFSDLLYRTFLVLSLISTIVGIPTSVVFAVSSTQSPSPCAYPMPDMLYAVRTVEKMTPENTTRRSSEILIIDPEMQVILCSSEVVSLTTSNTLDYVSDIAFNQTNALAFDENSFYGVTHLANDLVRIHPANWGISELNEENIGPGGMDSLAIGGDGFAYGTTDDSVNGSRLVQIDRNAGKAVSTTDSLLRDQFGNPDVLSTDDLAFREDGVLFAAVKRSDDINFPNSWLVTIDRSTGAATLVGDIGYPDVTGLSFRHGILYGITQKGEILIIDQAYGFGTILPSLSSQLMSSISDPSDQPPLGFHGLATHVKPGDANGDGNVDGIDYVIWLNHYNWQTSRGRSDGDFNGDGVVDGIDYVIWLNNYGK